MNETRTDAHRVSQLVASDYTYVLGYALGTSSTPSMGVDCERPQWDGATRRVVPGRPHTGSTCCLAALRASGAKKAEHGGAGRCTVCGAAFMYGEVWRHTPTGEHVHLGWECADKYGMVSGSREQALAYKAAMAEQRSVAAKEQKRAAARDAWLAEHPATAAALAHRDDARPELPPTTCGKVHGEDEQGVRYIGDCRACDKAQRDAQYHPATRRVQDLNVLADLYKKLHQYGSLSEKQEAFAQSLAARVTAPLAAPRPEEAHVPAPTGRVTLTGVVVAAKAYENDFGTRYAMTVKVATPAGSWLAWMTVPQGLGYSLDNLKGLTVTVKATLKPGADAHFAMGSRPVLVEVQG